MLKMKILNGYVKTVLNNIFNLVFDSSILSNAFDVPPENIQRKKAKHMDVSVTNFQSIWNKHSSKALYTWQLMTLC